MSPKHSEHLEALLDALVEYVRDYVVMSATQADAVALWTAHTWALGAFETTPFLSIASPEKRCGKTRTLDVLELVAARPWRTIMPSEAVLYRKIEAVEPTLMLDECDAIFDKRNQNTEPLRALLNSGNRRGTFVPRCVGPKLELVDFPTFSAKVLAGIDGNMPDTISDRSIVIRLARKRADESARRFRRREAVEVAEPIALELASWAQDAVADLEASRPRIPDGLNDRAEEAWEPLIAIADLADGTWPERARRAALELSGGREAEDEALGSWLLRDIRVIFEQRGTDRLSSADLAASLNEIEESPWGDIRGKALDARSLARRLKRFAIRPRTVRLDDDTTAKGYLLEAFEDAFARYLSASDRHTDTTRTDTGFEPTSEPSHVTDAESRKPASANACDGVTDENADKGNRAYLGLGEDGFYAFVKDAYRAGHITREELLKRLRMHGLVLRAAPLIYGRVDNG